MNVKGESGHFSRYLHSYGRTGEPCDRCDTALVRTVVGGLRTRLGGEAIARQSAVCGTIYAVTVIHMLDGRKSKTAEKERIS